jgi:hypothetical protein
MRLGFGGVLVRRHCAGSIIITVQISPTFSGLF